MMMTMEALLAGGGPRWDEGGLGLVFGGLPTAPDSAGCSHHQRTPPWQQQGRGCGGKPAPAACGAHAAAGYPAAPAGFGGGTQQRGKQQRGKQQWGKQQQRGKQ